MRVDGITSGDGASIVVRSIGTGPGIVILHGGGVAERDYHRLAQALSDRFEVHLYNRRGRPDSAPLNGTETVETDTGDLAAVLEHTGARRIFGHSGGGFVALRAGLSLQLERIAVYDPGLSILGRPSFAFIDQFEEAVRTGDYPRAMTVMSRSVYPDDPAAKLPFGTAQLISRAFLHTPIGRRFADLMPTMPAEIRRIGDNDGPATDYAGITADVLSPPVPVAPITSPRTAKQWRMRYLGAGRSSSPGHRTTRPTSPGRVSSGPSPPSSRARSRQHDRKRRVRHGDHLPKAFATRAAAGH